MKVRDLMTREVATLTEDATVGDAMAMLDEHGVRHIPILSDGELVGMLSDRDVRRMEGLLALGVADSARSEAVLQTPVMQVVSGAPLNIDPDASVDELIDQLLDRCVGAMAVVGKDGQVQGIVSFVDVLRAAKGKL